MKAHERGTTEKKCNKCESVKPLTEFYFRKKRNVYESFCKDCIKANSKKSALNRKAEIAIYQKEYREQNQERLTEQKKQYWLDTKEVQTEKKKLHYEANKERILASQKEYYETHKEQHAAAGRKWIAKNAEKVTAYQAKHYQENKEQHRKNDKAWIAKNIHWYKSHRLAYGRTRKIHRKKATPQWADMEAIVAIYDERARITEETGIMHHVDHIIPLKGETVSGLHVHTNLQILPMFDNLSKGSNFSADDIV